MKSLQNRIEQLEAKGPRQDRKIVIFIGPGRSDVVGIRGGIRRAPRESVDDFRSRVSSGLGSGVHIVIEERMGGE